MSVLTEITNSDKDILLSGDCTIKTKLITSKERLPIQIYDGIYDSENDSYYILGESTQETRSGKILFDINYTYKVGDTFTYKGVTITFDENGYITLNGTADTAGDLNIVAQSYTITLDKDIYLCFEALSGSVSNPSRGVSVQAINKSGASIWNYGANANNPIMKVPYSEITSIKWFRVPLVVGLSFNNYKFRFWVSTDNSLNYEPYGVMPSPDYPSEVKSISGTIGIKTKEDTVVVVDLEDNELCGITAKDKLTIKDGKATIAKRIGKYIANNDFSSNGISDTLVDLVTPILPIEANLTANALALKTMSNLMTGTVIQNTGLNGTTSVSTIRVSLSKKYASSYAEASAYLTSNNFTIYYELATPQEITLTNVNTYTIQTLTEENSVKDWEISDDRYVENNGVIGQFVARDTSGNLQNISDDFNIENNYVQVQIGISQFNSNITNWYSLGSFLITKPSDDEVIDNTKYNGYDLATLFNIDFNPKYVNKDFPKSFNQMLEEQKYVTNKWLANYVCAQAEVELATQDFIHNDFQVLSNQFTSGESCRDVMRYIAQLAFGYCEIGWDDKCYIRTLSNDYSSFDDYHKLNYDTYYNLETQKNEYGPINRVFCGLQDVDGQGKENIDKSTIENGVTTINIYNNPLTMGTTLEISEQLRAQVVKDCGVLWGIKYRPITNMETIGHPWFKANEPIQVSDMENKTFITYPFNNTLKYTGHIKSEISSEGNTKSEDTYGYKDSVERRMNRIGINVDRANEKITIINQQITKIGDDIKDIRGNMLEIGDVYTKSEIRDIVSGVGVDGTVVTSVETATTIFDINGMTVGRTDSPTKTNINSNGMIITNANDNTELLKINNSGVYSENLTARTYLNFGTHGRFEKYTENNRTRIGCFWIEGDD